VGTSSTTELSLTEESTLAEDGVRLCKRGHPRIPENVDAFRHCIPCLRLAQYRYERSPKGQATKARYEKSARGIARYVRYNATAAGWGRHRRNELKGAREAIQAKLESLKREEEECLIFLARQTLTR
jgi:hypothetical protein